MKVTRATVFGQGSLPLLREVGPTRTQQSEAQHYPECRGGPGGAIEPGNSLQNARCVKSCFLHLEQWKQDVVKVWYALQAIAELSLGLRAQAPINDAFLIQHCFRIIPA